MLISSHALFVAILVVIVAGLVLWANPGRTVNRLVSTFSLHIAAWLACLHMARRVGVEFDAGEFWFRTLHAVSASIPLHFLLVKDAITKRLGTATAGRIVWLGTLTAATLALTVIPMTGFFIPEESTQEMPINGPGREVVTFGMRILIGVMLVDVFRSLRRTESALRVELQVWLLGGCAMGVGQLLLEAMFFVTRQSQYIHVFQPYLVLLFYIGTAYAITTARIFDARHIFYTFLTKGTLVAVVALFAFVLDQLFVMLLSGGRLGSDMSVKVMAWIGTTALALWFAGTFSSWLSARLNLYPQDKEARQAAHMAAGQESSAEKLTQAFLRVLRGWAQAEHALLNAGPKGSFKIGTVDAGDEHGIMALMRELGWATPERLQRERTTPERVRLGRFLQEHNLGILVMREGTTLTVLVGVGYPASRRPYTYPQVTHLQELTSIMEEALERAHYSIKAQRAEQLATVGMLGAGLAHEIRNPLVTIKTFVQLLPNHYAEAAFRDKFFRLIGDEVTRIDRLTEQLLDMASPRLYEPKAIPLNAHLRTSLELVAAKAADRRIRIIVDFAANPDLVMSDASAARQVLLNLALNSIHAVEGIQGERWIRVATRNVPEGVEMSLSDNGQGISADMMPRLFQPFQSTKSSGFGLGLAICSDILSGLKATIAADPPRPGTGATFRVIFPCPPPSS